MKNPTDNVPMQVSGNIIAAIPRFIKKKFGEEGLMDWLSQITAEAREVYIAKIDVGQWYPLKTILIEPTANIAQLFYEWDLKRTAWELGRFSADVRFKGPLKVLVKIPSANFFVSKGAEFLSSYYKPCEVEVPENSPGSARFRITHFPEMEQTIESRIGGWIERGLELNGCKSVKVSIPKSLVRLDPYTEFAITWKS
jgi:hypothetical protein